uniref:Uncharacterized protein n=1 Tax=Trichogramma kaykai TaxID=54128 RepID=A0ABD2WS41_9HYME
MTLDDSLLSRGRAANSAGDRCQRESCGRTTIISLDMATREPTHANGPAASADALSALPMNRRLYSPTDRGGVAQFDDANLPRLCPTRSRSRRAVRGRANNKGGRTTGRPVKRATARCSLLYRWSSCLLAQRSTLLLLFFFFFFFFYSTARRSSINEQSESDAVRALLLLLLLLTANRRWLPCTQHTHRE